MGLFGFGFKKKEDNGNACIFCGMEVVDGVCTQCGREKRPMVDFSAFDFKPVPESIAAALDAQEKSIYSGAQKLVSEMIKTGNLFVADILFDSVVDDSNDDEDDFFDEIYVQFSTPDDTPCSKCCRALGTDGCIVEDSLKSGHREGLLLKGIRKNLEYYYAFAPKDTLENELCDEKAFGLITHGTGYDDRRIAPKGIRNRIEFRRVITASFDDAK